MLVTLAAAAVLAQSDVFYSNGPYDQSVPKPESILGYGPGEKTTTYRDQEQVVLAIAKSAPDRVRVIQYGTSTEGRPLRIFAISSAKNMARLDEIQKEHEDLASGKGDPTKTVPIVWINECIHGDETASFESGMWTLYNLVASNSRQVQGALDKEVVIFNPVYNPDGHERYTVYYDSVAVGSDDPRAYERTAPNVMLGRLNHYRFDMNRDRVAFSQKETREEFATMLHWGPQVYIDQHGQVESYFFPPEPMAINPNVDRARNNKWTDIFGRATAKAFDQRGYSYFTKNEFDLWYPGYLDASTTLSGAIGMTHETDGGRVLAEKRPDDSVLTLRHGVEKHFASAIAVVETAADNAASLLADYTNFKHKAVTGELSGKFKHVVVSAPDSRPLFRLQQHLFLAGIKSTIIAGKVSTKSGHDYWSSQTGGLSGGPYCLQIDLAQPQAAMAKALLEPNTEFEPEFIKAQIAKKKAAPEGEKYPGPEGTEFYDFTGWALPYAYSLPAYWCEDTPRVETGSWPAMTMVTPSNIGYILPYNDEEDALAALDLLNKGVKGSVSTKAMTLGGRTYNAGSFVFLNERNSPDLMGQIQEESRLRNARIEPLSTAYPETERFSPGGGQTEALRKPSIAVVMGRSGSLAESGYIWYLMEQVFKIKFTPITEDALRDSNLDRFTCIVLPQGVGAPTDSHFKEWIQAGGSAIAFGPESEFAGVEKVKGEFQELPGSLFRAQIDPRSFLSFGYPMNSAGQIEIGVPVQGNEFYKQKKEGGSMVFFSPDATKTKLLSGWSWPGETEKALTGAVFAQDVPMGRGHFVMFTEDPTERALWPGLNKLVLNAMLFGSAR